MGFRFRKSIKLSSGIKFNFSKKGASTTIGKKGLSINTGTHGTFLNVGIPGTGISSRTKITGYAKRSRNNNSSDDSAITGAVYVGFIIGGILFFMTEVAWLSILAILIVPLVIIFAPEQEQQNKEEIIPVAQTSQKIQETQEYQKGQENKNIIPAQQEIDLNSLFPNKYGLYPHEILALYLLPDENNYAKYWEDKYFINDLPALLRSLKDRGFMTIHFPTDEEILNLYSASELRTILKNHEIKSPRKKIDMIQSILGNLSPQENQELITAKISLFNANYVLTEKGKEAIKDDEYVLYAHKYKNDEFNIYSLNKLMKGDTLNYQKYIWQILTEKCSEYFKSKDFGAYSSTKLHLSDFFAEQYDYLSALRFLSEVIYIDINTLDSTDITSGIIGRLYEYQEKLSLTDEQLSVMLSEYFNNINLPSTYHSVSECVDITLKALHN